MNCNIQKLKSCFQSAEELRAREWMKLEDRIKRRALVLWRRKGRVRMDALSAWRRAEQELLPRNGTASV